MNRSQHFIMRNAQVAQNAVNLINRLPLDNDKPIWEVVVRKFKRKRSVDQNNLVHMWFQIIANETGNDMETVKEYIKAKYLAPVFREWVDPATKEKSLVGCSRSTTDLTVEEMTAFINNVEQFALELGVILPMPEEYRYLMDVRNRGGKRQ